VTLPPRASMAAIAAVEARETRMWIGERRISAPRARSFTPSFIPCRQREAESSLIVMGWEGSRRP